MAKTDEKIMTFVQDEMKKSPDISSTELYDKARAKNMGVEKLSLRQFHARYPLQVKRRQSTQEAGQGGGGGRKKAGKKTTAKKKTTTKKKKARTRSGGRRRKSAKSSSGGQSDGSGVDRDSIRNVFLRFASDLAGAEARQDVVKVLARVDRYVDDVEKAARK